MTIKKSKKLWAALFLVGFAAQAHAFKVVPESMVQQAQRMNGNCLFVSITAGMAAADMNLYRSKHNGAPLPADVWLTKWDKQMADVKPDARPNAAWWRAVGRRVADVYFSPEMRDMLPGEAKELMQSMCLVHPDNFYVASGIIAE